MPSREFFAKLKELPYCPTCHKEVYAHKAVRVTPIYWYWKQVQPGDTCPLCEDAILTLAPVELEAVSMELKESVMA